MPLLCDIRDRYQAQQGPPRQEGPFQAGHWHHRCFGVWEVTSPTGSCRGRETSPAESSDPLSTPCVVIWGQGEGGGWFFFSQDSFDGSPSSPSHREGSCIPGVPTAQPTERFYPPKLNFYALTDHFQPVSSALLFPFSWLGLPAVTPSFVTSQLLFQPHKIPFWTCKQGFYSFPIHTHGALSAQEQFFSGEKKQVSV